MPTYSEITITFTNDWVSADALKFKSWDTLTDSQNWWSLWTWVTTRSSGFEVTTGTPTANAGERAAINFEAAFDLDYPTGYVTTVQNDNEVLIQSETLGEDFVGGKVGDTNTGTATFAFNNYVVPPTAANSDLALVLSPHYITTPFYFTTTTAITIDLYIWSGDLTSLPGTVTQSLTKTRPTTDYTEFNTNISDVVRSYLDETPQYDITPNVQLLDNNSVKWVYALASYTDATETISDLEAYLVATEGYGWYSEGVNPSNPSNLVLSDCTNRKVDRNSFVLLPFINDGTITSIVCATENTEINTTLNPSSSVQSTDYIQYISINVAQSTSDETLTITFSNGAVYTYEIVDECRYSPMTIVFKNKYGVYETAYMFKKQTSSISTDSEMFVNNYISSGSYTTTKHQYQKLNVQGKKSITLNSGYISEDENDLYEQILLSDKVFFYDSAYVPVNVKSSSLEFKTRVNDHLVNYQLEFEYAYNIIQNV